MLAILGGGWVGQTESGKFQIFFSTPSLSHTLLFFKIIMFIKIVFLLK